MMKMMVGCPLCGKHISFGTREAIGVSGVSARVYHAQCNSHFFLKVSILQSVLQTTTRRNGMSPTVEQQFAIQDVIHSSFSNSCWYKRPPRLVRPQQRWQEGPTVSCISALCLAIFSRVFFTLNLD